MSAMRDIHSNNGKQSKHNVFERFFKDNTLPAFLVDFYSFSIKEANKHAELFLGVNPKSMIGEKFTQFVADQKKHLDDDIRSFIEKRYTGLELTFQCANILRNAEVHYSIIGKGETRMLLLTLVDVTERNNALKSLREIQENLANEIRNQTSDLVRINTTLIEQIKTRRKAEEELRKSQETFIRIFELNPNGMLLRSIESDEVIEVNQSFLNIFGLSRSDIVNQKFEAVNLFCDYQEYQNVKNKLLKNGFLRSEPLSMISTHGHIHFVVYNAEIVQLDDENFVLEVYQDITEIQITQQKLADSEERYRSMFNNALVGIFRIEVSTGVIINSNLQFAKILGYKSANEIIGKSILPHYPSISAREDLFERLRQKDTSVLEYELVTKDNKRVWIVNYARINSKEGYIDSVVVDITDRKVMEKLLTNSENRFRGLIEHASDIILIVDKNGKASYLSPSVQRELGYKIGTITKANILDFVHPQDKDTVLRVLNEKTDVNRRLEVRVIHRRGNFEVYEFTATNLLNDPLIGGIVINARNISEQAKAREEMSIALQKEQELSRQKTQFISTVSHEFRTPLTNISLNIQLLQKYIDENKTERASSSLDRMGNAIKRLTALLNEVSLISKEQSGRLQFAPETWETHSLLHEVLDQLSYLISSNVKVVLQKVKNQAVLVDINLIIHIIGNLLSNSTKYSPNDCPVFLRIKVTPDLQLHIFVEDNGMGVPENEIKYLFDPYFRASNVKEIKGAGLGLSIVKRCVDLHGGAIDVVTKLNQGTKVSCLIPMQKV